MSAPEDRCPTCGVPLSEPCRSDACPIPEDHAPRVFTPIATRTIHFDLVISVRADEQRPALEIADDLLELLMESPWSAESDVAGLFSFDGIEVISDGR